MNLFVCNISYSMTEQELEELFSACGQVNSAKIINDRESGRSRGFAFVDMPDDDAKIAIEKLNGQEVGGRNIKVAEAEQKKQNYNRSNYQGGRDRRY